MRSPPPTNCAGLQHTLTAEAASVLKHSLLLARRRGHAQLTPLHVAPTLLSLSPSFKRACLTSHPPPPSPSPSSSSSHHHLLQCRALELCFNVALNRLPTTPSPFLHSSPQPSLSNALLAALKRAQAHQRRGSLDHHHNQPLLTTVKIHLEHLTISILDDPSVSRVMREAGFSSTAVKNNLEDFSNNNNSPPSSLFHSGNGGVFSSPCSPSASENTSNNHHLLFSSPPKKPPSSLLYPLIAPSSYSKEEDVKAVMDILLLRSNNNNDNKKKNVVIVGDSVSLTESLVGEIIGRFQRSEVPHELKTAEFIRFHHFRSLKHMKRSEVDMKLMELKRKVVDGNNGHGGGGIIVYIGDLKWTVVDEEEEEEGGGGGGYGRVVDHVVSEIGKLFCGETTNKVWLMATATYQTYIKCQMRQPPLEMQWCLHPLLLPSPGLALTLHSSGSVHGSKMSISQNPYHAVETKLNCCEECASNFEKESQLLRSGQKKTLPLWLQPHSTEAHHHKDELSELKRKWNRLCQCLHQTKEEAQNYWSNNGSWNSSSSVCFTAKPATLLPTHSSNLVPRFRRQNSCTTIEFNFRDKRQATTEPVLGSMELEGNKEVIKTTLALGNGGSSSGSGSETVVVENITDRTLRRAHFCKLLQENLPWHSETVPSIAEALLHSKSAKQSNITLFFLQGNDNIGKTRLALAVKESLFGSQDNNFIHMDMLKKQKKKKEASMASHSDMLLQALKSHDQKLVVLIENVDFADAQFRKCISDGFETGKFGNLRIAEENSSSQVVFILTSSGGGFTSNNNEEKNQDFVMKFMLQISETKPNNNLDPPIFGHKRRVELDLFSKIKSPRIEEKNEQCNSRKKDFSRNSSFSTLDLNMKADEDDDHDDKTGESSPISSDLTLETAADPLNPNNGFLDSIENKFEFITSPAREREKSEMFLTKIKGCFEDACGKQNLVNFSVDERVIQEICNRCGYFTNSLFEKWLKDIFQRSLLERVNHGGGEEKGILFRLCWGGNGKEDHRNLDRNEGFMGSPLPNCIQVNYLMGG